MVSDGLEVIVTEAVAELDEEEEPVVVAEYVCTEVIEITDEEEGEVLTSGLDETIWVSVDITDSLTNGVFVNVETCDGVSVLKGDWERDGPEEDDGLFVSRVEAEW